MKTDKARGFDWHWQYQQGAMFLKEKYNSIDMKKSLAEFFYGMGCEDNKAAVEQIEQKLAEKDAEIVRIKGKLKMACDALKTIHIGVDPRNGEWSEQFQDTMLKAFTAKTASDYANEELKQLEEM